MENIARDEDGFPVASVACIGTLFTDEFGVVWAFQWVDDYGWCWVTLGETWFAVPREDGEEPDLP